MRVALITSELAPFAKSGGLADAVAGLAEALREIGVEPLIVMPRYRGIESDGLRAEGRLEVVVGAARIDAGLLRAETHHGVPVYLVDIPAYYDRAGLYGEGGADYADNCARFTALCRAALQVARRPGSRCELLHAHDWQAALVPFYLKTLLAGDADYRDCRSVFTVHNLAYQGVFDAAELSTLGLDARWLTPRYLEYYGRLNLMKGALVGADALTTVSAVYAREILEPEQGCGLDGVLRDRAGDLVGIRNGIDETDWDPESDPHIPVRFRAASIQGKGRCKAALQRELGLPEEAGAPLFGVVSRLAHQKGIDLLVDAFPRLLDGGAQWAMLGSGEAAVEAALRELARRHPRQVAVRLRFDEGLSHRIQAGADFLVMPSRFEPCGLNQMYAMRYGTVPVVRAVGGLAETVRDLDGGGSDGAGLDDGGPDGTGIVFRAATPDAIAEACARARAIHRKRGLWAPLRRRLMALDHSWRGPARTYAELYERVLSRPPAPVPAGPGSRPR